MNLDELEKLAKAATPGPWHEIDIEWDYGDNRSYLDINTGDSKELWIEAKPTDLDFIAAANPEIVLKLIAVARAARLWFTEGKEKHFVELQKAQKALDCE